MTSRNLTVKIGDVKVNETTGLPYAEIRIVTQDGVVMVSNWIQTEITPENSLVFHVLDKGEVINYGGTDYPLYIFKNGYHKNRPKTDKASVNLIEAMLEKALWSFMFFHDTETLVGKDYTFEISEYGHDYWIKDDNFNAIVHEVQQWISTTHAAEPKRIKLGSVILGTATTVYVVGVAVAIRKLIKLSI